MFKKLDYSTLLCYCCRSTTCVSFVVNCFLFQDIMTTHITAYTYYSLHICHPTLIIACIYCTLDILQLWKYTRATITCTSMGIIRQAKRDRHCYCRFLSLRLLKVQFCNCKWYFAIQSKIPSIIIWQFYHESLSDRT